MPSSSDPSLDPYADPDYYEHPKPHKSRKIEITWSVLHLTYVGLFTCGLEAAVETLEKSFKAKGYTLQKISAIEEKVTACRMIGPEPYPHTHIAIDINKGETERFKTNGLTIFTIEGNTPQLPHVRLVKYTGHWNHIWNTYHYKEPGASPLQRIGDGPLRRMPPKTIRLSKKENAQKIRYERNKAAYDAFCRSNTYFIAKIHEALQDSGMSTKMWIPYVRNAELVADYYHQDKQALVYTNNWSGESIAKDMQESITAGNKPPLIILVLNRSAHDIIPHLPDIYKLSEYIVTGCLQYRRATRHDIPLSTWRPNVIIFATFNSTDLSVDWTQLLAGSPTSTSHILANHTSYEQMEHIAAEVPDLQVCVLPIHTIRRALAVYEPGPPLPHEINTLATERAARIFFNHFTPHMLKLYWEKGYHPVIAFIGIYDIRRKARISDIVGSTQPVDPDDLTKSIGHTIQMGGLIIKSIQLDDEEKEQLRLDYEQGAVRALITPGRAREIVEIHGLIPSPPRLTAPPVDPHTELKNALFQVKGGPFPDFGTVNEAAIRNLDAFLNGYDTTRGITTPTPLGDIRTDAWILKQKKVIVELDYQLPSRGEAFKMLYWLEQEGHTTIRIRADDVGLDWRGRPFTVYLEDAIREKAYITYLDRVPERDSWKELRESVGENVAKLMGHVFWWEENVGPLPEMPRTPEPEETPEPARHNEPEGLHTPEIPPAQPRAGSAASGSGAAPPRKNGWAIYTRTLGGDGLGGPDLERDINHKLAWQQNTCIAYAQKYGLAPVAGPHQVFADRCPPNAPFDTRPGLAALVASGAAGILSVDCLRFSDCSGDPAGWLHVNGLEFRAAQ
jgi:hypothetical protein